MKTVGTEAVSRPKCLVILSTKSSGSSACQRLLAGAATVNLVEKTRHRENETLYWVKAASVLGLPQQTVQDSEIPIPPTKARRDLVALLEDNVPGYCAPLDDERLVFEGWQTLCHHYAPVFLEKSPHHLRQRSALDLLVDCMERCVDVDFLLVGLVRNPMDTLYSMFQRWRTLPEAAQYEWLAAYQNLLDLAERVGDKLVIVRYEDMVSSSTALAPVYDFMGVDLTAAAAGSLHGRSLAKWRQDGRFGFQLAAEVRDLAAQFGYPSTTVENESSRWWPAYCRLARASHKLIRPPRRSMTQFVASSRRFVRSW
ncbi:MAG: sulfotransferase [Caldilineaceae bacterium]|nr:sulfotransferase [Caldilineaceae bacterium]